MQEQAQEYREKLIDMIVELDDDVLTAYFEVRLRHMALRRPDCVQTLEEYLSSMS